MDAGPWLPQCVQAENEADEYYYGRGVREPEDVEMTSMAQGSRDLPRVNVEKEKVDHVRLLPKGAFSPTPDAQAEDNFAAPTAKAPPRAPERPSARWLAKRRKPRSDTAELPGAASSQSQWALEDQKPEEYWPPVPPPFPPPAELLAPELSAAPRRQPRVVPGRPGFDDRPLPPWHQHYVEAQVQANEPGAWEEWRNDAQWWAQQSWWWARS